MTLLRYIIFVSTEGILCFLKANFHARFAPALLADVVWCWRPLVTGAASYPVLRFLGTRTGKLARPS